MSTEATARSPVRHESFFEYDRKRYLWILLGALVVLPILMLRRVRTALPIYGTPLMVWATGVVAFGLVLWLLFYGVRRRLYPTSAAPLRGWLSAHVYLGLLPLLIVPIHASFRFGVNVHTLAFALMAVVILSGVVGAALYGTLPIQIASQSAGTYEERLDALALIKARWFTSRARAKLSKSVVATVDTALDEQLTGDIWTRRRRSAQSAIAALTALTERDDEIERLIAGLGDWDQRMQRLARELRLRAWLHAWKVIHIPIAYATLVAIIVHVIVVVAYR